MPSAAADRRDCEDAALAMATMSRQTPRITGERATSPEGGFNPAWQRHVAEYHLLAPELGPGRVLDLGCGVGHSFDALSPRESVGVDLDPEALAGQARETVVAEARRVLEPGGVAVFVTPNRLTFGRPDEIIDPFHHVELDPAELRALCARAFADVDLRGVFASERYMTLYRVERAQLDRLLRRDPLRLRRFVPVRAKRRLYDVLLRRYRRDDDPRAAAITREDFFLSGNDLEAALDLCAICRG